MFPKREAELTEDVQAIANDAHAARAAAFEQFADLRLDSSYLLARLILRDKVGDTARHHGVT